MEVLIENYRGFDIKFSTDSEKFTSIVSDDNTKESKSFKAVKKFIDDYKKLNINFKSFEVTYHPDWSDKFETLSIIGRRKDGRFISKDSKGKESQVYNYKEDNYIVVVSENIPLLNKLAALNEENAVRRKEFLNKKAALISKMNIITLKEKAGDL